LFDLRDFFTGDVVVMNARADAYGAVERLGHALGHVLRQVGLLVAGQTQKLNLNLRIVLRLPLHWGVISHRRGKGYRADMGCSAPAEHLQVAPLAKYAQMYG